MKKLIKMIFGNFILIFVMLASIAIAGIVTLTWQATTTNIDGTPITDLAGYNIYWGTTSRGTVTTPPANYPNKVTVASNVTSTALTLPTGTYYFSVTAFNTSGLESGFSNEVSKYVAPTLPSPPSSLQGTVTGVRIGA